MSCIGDNTMLDLLERRIPDRRRAEIHAHLEVCTRCREMVAAAAGALSFDDSSSLDAATHVDSGHPGIQPPPLPTLDLDPGTVVDHYRVVSLLGRGGMGQVYAARDTTLDRDVALKLIKPDVLDYQKAYDMFTTEARATARLNHPNIVTIHAVGRYRGLPYVALERLVGKTLRTRMKEGRLEPTRVVSIARSIANALATAHAQSVFHRDLKPANIMLCDDGTTRVLDFGLAIIADADHQAARHAAAGTPAYMAPEQWISVPATGATDVWALGVIMFEMCTGSRPYDKLFEASPDLTMHLLDLASAVRSDDDTPIAEALAAARVPEGLSEIITRCLLKIPGERPTAEEVARALTRVELEMTVSAMSLPLSASKPPPATPPRRAWLLVAAGVGALVVGGVTAIVAVDGPAPAVLRAGWSPPAVVLPERSAARADGQPSASSAASAAPSARPTGKRWDPMSYR